MNQHRVKRPMAEPSQARPAPPASIPSLPDPLADPDYTNYCDEQLPPATLRQLRWPLLYPERASWHRCLILHLTGVLPTEWWSGEEVVVRAGSYIISAETHDEALEHLCFLVVCCVGGASLWRQQTWQAVQR